MNIKKYMSFVLLSLVVVMAFAGCSSKKIDNGGIEVDKEIIQPVDDSENLDEDMMLIDIRETISGLLDGEFPSIIVSDNSINHEVDEDLVFAIALDENPSTGYSWAIKENDSFELIGDGYIAIKTEELMVGSGGTHYYGIKVLSSGEFQVEFELIAPSGDVEETRVFNISSK